MGAGGTPISWSHTQRLSFLQHQQKADDSAGKEMQLLLPCRGRTLGKGVSQLRGCFPPTVALRTVSALGFSYKERARRTAGLRFDDAVGSRVENALHTEAFSCSECPGSKPGLGVRGGEWGEGFMQKVGRRGRVCRIIHPFSWRPRRTWFTSGARGSLELEKEHRIEESGSGENTSRFHRIRPRGPDPGSLVPRS